MGTFTLRDIPPMPRAKPQIEVIFDIDANGILNVSAEEKGSKKKEQITITNDKGRLSKQDIEQMIKEAEEYAALDTQLRETVESKAYLENFCYSMKETMNDKDVLELVPTDARQRIVNSVGDALSWLEITPTAEKDELDARIKELEAMCNPIMVQYHTDRHAKLSAARPPPAEGSEGAAGAEGGGPSAGAGSPEDVD